MRDVRKLGLVKYFSDVLEYNRLNRTTLPYDPNHHNLLEWTAREIYEAKVSALSIYFNTLIKSNPLHSERGTRYNHKGLLQMGWTEKEIESAKKKNAPSLAKIIVLITLVVLGLLFAVKYINKLTGHG